jgi:hypothetical protein
MEDELSEARLEASKLKTELISERSAWEVKLSELQSHVNEVVILVFIASMLFQIAVILLLLHTVTVLSHGLSALLNVLATFM